MVSYLLRCFFEIKTAENSEEFLGGLFEVIFGWGP